MPFPYITFPTLEMWKKDSDLNDLADAKAKFGHLAGLAPQPSWKEIDNLVQDYNKAHQPISKRKALEDLKTQLEKHSTSNKTINSLRDVTTRELRLRMHLSFHQQVIFEYLSEGVTEMDKKADLIITGGTDNLIQGCTAKGIRSHRVPFKSGGYKLANQNRRAILEANSWITGPFRLYLRGHGDFEAMKLGGRTAQDVCAHVGILKLDECRVISITGC